MSNSAVVESVAQALRNAELSKTAIAPVRPQLGGESADVDIAYAVQEVNTERATLLVLRSDWVLSCSVIVFLIIFITL